MKTSIQSNLPELTKPGFKTHLATIASVGMLALGSVCFVAPAHAGPLSANDLNILQDVVEVVQESQVAQLD